MYLRINGEGFDDGKGKGPSRLVQARKALKTFTVLKAGARVIEQELIDFGRNPTAIYKARCFGEFIGFFVPESGGNN
jgi:hypothetical protein